MIRFEEAITLQQQQQQQQIEPNSEVLLDGSIMI
jgi:hypothetical protein